MHSFELSFVLEECVVTVRNKLSAPRLPWLMHRDTGSGDSSQNYSLSSRTTRTNPHLTPFPPAGFSSGDGPLPPAASI